jgi:predicted MFS family arabinose efflux permease
MQHEPMADLPAPEPPQSTLPATSSNRHRRLILVLGLGGFATALASRTLDPLVVVLAQEFGAPVATVALLTTAFALPYALVQPFLGPIGDALGKRRVIVACLMVLMLALLLAAFAPSLPILFLARLLAGGAAGGIMPVSLALVGDSVPLQERQLALSRLLVASITGQIAGGVLAAALEPTIGWRGVNGLCCVAALLALAVQWRERQRAEATAPEPQHRFDAALALRRYRDILANPAARRLFLAVFLESVLIFACFPFIAAILHDEGLGGTAEAGMAVAGFGVGGFLYALLAPALLRRLQTRRIVALAGAVAAVALLGMGFAPLAMAFVGACLLLGLGFYMLHNSIQVGVTELAPRARGSAVSLHAFSFFIGQSLGPVLFGAAFHGLGAAATLSVSAAGIAMLGIWLGRRSPGA